MGLAVVHAAEARDSASALHLFSSLALQRDFWKNRNQRVISSSPSPSPLYILSFCPTTGLVVLPRSVFLNPNFSNRPQRSSSSSLPFSSSSSLSLIHSFFLLKLTVSPFRTTPCIALIQCFAADSVLTETVDSVGICLVTQRMY